MKIFDKINEWKNTNKPFVVFKKPNSTKIQAYFQNDLNVVYTDDFETSGFVFAPFNNQESAVIFSEETSIYLEEEITIDEFKFDNKSITFKEEESSKNYHIKLVEKGISAINYGEFKKVVLSRKESINLDNADSLSIYKKLLFSYPTAMVYWWNHPKIGSWMGATPETLLQINNDSFTTMSLAGTQLYNGTTNVKWQAKEIEEQQFVTDYILQNLVNNVSEVSVSDTETIKAGKLLHLQTKITGTHKNNTKNLINSLHPTPAVCGLPKEASKDFILNNENYNRSFYTGFLGELNIKNTSHLFVNLRCMEINNNAINIYVGGGITADSNAEKEWLETVNKTSTIKKVL